MRNSNLFTWIFFGKVRMRTGWRLVIFSLIVFVLFLLSTSILLQIIPEKEIRGERQWDSLSADFFVLFIFITVLLSSFIMVKYFDKRPFASIGLSFDTGWLKEIAYGLIAGFLLTSLLFLVGLLINSYRVSINEEGASFFLHSFIKYFILILIYASFEEVIFRGYPLQTLIEGIGNTLSIIILSSIFGLLHSFNPNSSLIGILNTALAGAFLSIIYIKGRSLWLPIFIHFSWNFSMGYIFALPVSGIDFDGTPLITSSIGPEILSGGEFGLEGSILTTFLLSFSIMVLIIAKFPKPTAKMKRRWDNYYAQGKESRSLESMSRANHSEQGRASKD